MEDFTIVNYYAYLRLFLFKNMHVDPVCKMELQDQAMSVASQFEGVTYYFCCPSCKKVFEKNPQKFKQ